METDMATLFQSFLAERFDLLPEPVRRFHSLEREIFTSGRAKVSAKERTLGAALLAFVAGLPALAEDVETHVRFTPLSDSREFWRRNFGVPWRERRTAIPMRPRASSSLRTAAS
jgi:hypothetical protein